MPPKTRNQSSMEREEEKHYVPLDEEHFEISQDQENESSSSNNSGEEVDQDHVEQALNDKRFFQLFKKVVKSDSKHYFKAIVDEGIQIPTDFDASFLTDGKDGSNKSKSSKTHNKDKVKDHGPFYLRLDYKSSTKTPKPMPTNDLVLDELKALIHELDAIKNAKTSSHKFSIEDIYL